MWMIIARKELKEAIRKRVFLVLALLFWSLMGVTAYSSYGHYTNYTGQVKEAENMFRQEWEQQKRNPHSAAHFGTYLFKPLSFLGLYDPGINSYTGNTYRVEAHNQSEMNYAAAQDNDVQQRFGLLTIGLVFQLLMPLLIIFLCAPSITVERGHRTLQILVAQGMQLCARPADHRSCFAHHVSGGVAP
jgi:ABC-2 type transport system permease protein